MTEVKNLPNTRTHTRAERGRDPNLRRVHQRPPCVLRSSMMSAQIIVVLASCVCVFILPAG